MTAPPTAQPGSHAPRGGRADAETAADATDPELGDADARWARVGGAFEVERHRSEGATVLVLVGEVDIGTVPTLREALGAVPDGERLVVLDLRRLSFGDSSMLSTVMASCRRLRSHGGDLRLLGARGPVRQVLQITGVVQEVELFDTLREALDAPPRSSG